jgi:hypothetical protein
MVKYFYKNEEFNLKKCQFEIFEKYLRDDVELFKQKHPELEKVEFLDTHAKSKLFPDGSEINFFNISSGFIPNTLLGLVAAKKIIEDVDVYQNYARKNFFSGVKSSLVLFFRSGNSYMFNIAGNPFNYPEYFSSNLWNLDFLPKMAERKDLKVDSAPRKIVAIIILLSSLNTIFYILSVKQLTSNLILLFLCAIILISKIDNFKNIILIVFIFICCLYLFVLFKKTYEYVCCKLSNKNIVLENRDIIFFIYSIYFYYIIALVLTTPGEVERYRLVVDPLVALFSIFYLKKIMITLKKLILNIKKYYLF